MNDWWNDPPEVEEVPECCGREMQVLDNGACVCRVCKHRIEPEPDPDPSLFH